MVPLIGVLLWIFLFFYLYTYIFKFWSFDSNNSFSFFSVTGQSTYPPAEIVWLWKCKSSGMCFSIIDLSMFFFIVCLIILIADLMLTGKGGTKYLLHMFKILSSTWTYIWCNWVHRSNWYLVCWLRFGWTTSGTGRIALFSMVELLYLRKFFSICNMQFVSFGASLFSLARVV